MVLHQEHRHPQFGVDVAQQFRHRVHLLVADAAGGFVEEQQPRSRDQGPRQLDPLLDAEGKRRHRPLGVGGKPDEVDYLQGSLARRGLGRHRGGQRDGSLHPSAPRLHVVADEHVVEHGHGPEQGDVLERAREAVPDDVVRPDRLHGVSVDEYRAVARAVYAGDDVEERRLARAVRPDERDDLPGLDVE